MKRILIYLILFPMMTMLISCEKEIMDYKGREGVYFAVQHGEATAADESWPYQPYTDANFVNVGKDVFDVSVKVAITGPVKYYDRAFGIEVNPDSTTAVLGEHYEALPSEGVIPAGAVFASVKVRILRTPELENDPKTLGLRLLPTSQLSLSFPEWDAIPSLKGGTIVPKFDASLHTLRLTDVMIRPVAWNGTSNATTKRETGLLGLFTRRKMEFLTEHLGITYQEFASLETMPLIRVQVISNDATEILKRLFNEKKPLLEADGRLMWLGTVPWTSTLGVPYVPGP